VTSAKARYAASTTTTLIAAMATTTTTTTTDTTGTTITTITVASGAINTCQRLAHNFFDVMDQTQLPQQVALSVD
jgi:hypothetical protein